MEFTYQAGYVDDPWTLDVRVKNVGGTLFAMVNKDGKSFVQLRKIFGIWEVYGPTPQGFYADDIRALGEEIDKQIVFNK